jgi:hypothetical protein
MEVCGRVEMSPRSYSSSSLHETLYRVSRYTNTVPRTFYECISFVPSLINGDGGRGALFLTYFRSNNSRKGRPPFSTSFNGNFISFERDVNNGEGDDTAMEDVFSAPLYVPEMNPFSPPT